MKAAYALLGVLLLIILGGVWWLGGAQEQAEITSQDNDIQATMSTFVLTSSAFSHNGTIPNKYTCDGENINPPLEIIGVPAGAQSLALLMDDPDIPQIFKEQRGIDDFDHWALANIAPDTMLIPEGATPQGGVVGVNSAGNNVYAGPCPPPEYEPTEHRYIFKLYALDTVLELNDGATHEEIRSAMEGHVLGETELVGLYDRSAN